jgi:hypothetical protein
MIKRHCKSAKNTKKCISKIARKEERLRCPKRERSISLLLGAGFSAPMGYPVGNQLNEKLLSCNEDNLSFTPVGEICVNAEVNMPGNYYDSCFNFCKNAINYYNDNIKSFDYEEFYDYLKEKAKDDRRLKEVFENDDYSKKKSEDFGQYLYQISNIYNQLVMFYLKDEAGKSWYDDEPMKSKPIFNKYTGFLDCIEALSKIYIINVHTLNHDLFFERLNRTEWIDGELCDGFEELGSPFYGELQHDNRTYKCRLSRYTGEYDKKIRLYKLHGSKDYHVYYTNKFNKGKSATLYPETCIKTRWGVNNTDFYKEIKKKQRILKYENNSINYHPDFLTGTTSKINRYKDPFLYKKLFKLFKKNLNKAEMLIIVGYGCKDAEINRYVLEEFGTNKPCFMIDPFAGVTVTDFITKMGANTTLINKQIDKLSMSDINK